MYGDDNFPQILQQSKLLLKKARGLALPVAYKVLKGKTHFSKILSFANEDCEARNTIVEFIAQPR